MEEIFKDIPSYEGLYQVSNLGNVKSLNYNKTKQERILKHGILKTGYHRVQLHKDGKRKMFLVHRLVYAAFNGDIPTDMQVNHIDENKDNNTLNNLNLMTHKENLNHGTRNERSAKAISKSKTGVYNTKISKRCAKMSLDGEVLEVLPSTMEFQRLYGFSQGNISSCCNKRFIREGNDIYKGFRWSYIK